jgi:hypothetical protein
MSNDRCTFVVLASLVGLVISVGACVQKDRPHGPAVQADAEIGTLSPDAQQPGMDGYGGSIEPDGPATPKGDAYQPALDGFWDLVSTTSAATGTTTPVASGTVVVQFNNGVVTLYYENGATKSCGTNSYSLQGTTIAYQAGNVDSVVLTETTLSLTNVQPGGLFGKDVGDHSDFVRLTAFTPEDYGPCS